MTIVRILERWIEEKEKSPLSKDYQKAISDLKKLLTNIENEFNKDNGKMEIEIAAIGDFGFGGFSGPANFCFGQVVDYIDRHTRSKNEHKGKFLVEVKSRQFDPYERFKK